MTKPVDAVDFRQWSAEDVRPLLAGKSLIFSPGGSSRWYFMEHGSASEGYMSQERFLEYSRLTLDRVLEIVSMMHTDGVETVYVIAFTPQFDKRDPEYQRVMRFGLEIMVDAATRALYRDYEMAVKFRGMWSQVLAQYDLHQMAAELEDLEHTTAQPNRPRIVWCLQDKPIPDRLIPLVQNHLIRTGQMPDRIDLAKAYYGEEDPEIALFIGNNKPSIAGQLPPFLSPGDLYFTVSPTLYMHLEAWRDILYDHLFSRRVSYRDYTAIEPDALHDLDRFYQQNRSNVIGLGHFNPAVQVWQPMQVDG
jgi:hypothetical protein